MDSSKWEVIGGGDKGGLIVREGKKLDSNQLEDRLQTGSIVEELLLDGDRLWYQLSSGAGPETGWISIKLKGKDLVVRYQAESEDEEEEKKLLGYKLQEECEEMWAVGKGGADISVRLARTVKKSKVPCCAIFVNGMPHRAYGDSRMEDPLPTTIMKKCWGLGLPTVRFNYTGFGNSKGEEIAMDDSVTMPNNFRGVLDKVLREISDKVAIIAHSAGNLIVSVPIISQPTYREKCLAFVNINHGVRSKALMATSIKERDDLMAKPPEEFYAEHSAQVASLAHIPHLYIRGDQDWMSPEADIRYFISLQAEKLGSVKAAGELLTFPGTHGFEKTEGPPAQAVEKFLSRVLY